MPFKKKTAKPKATKKAAAKTEEPMNETEVNAKVLQSKLAEAEAQAFEAVRKNSEITDQLNAAAKNRDSLAAQVDILKEQLDEAHEKITRLQQEISNLKGGAPIENAEKKYEVVDTRRQYGPGEHAPEKKKDGIYYQPEVKDDGYARYKVPKSYAISLIFGSSIGRFVLSGPLDCDSVSGTVLVGLYNQKKTARRHSLSIVNGKHVWREASIS